MVNHHFSLPFGRIFCWNLFQASNANPSVSSNIGGNQQAYQVSNEKRAPGCFGFIGDYTTQLYSDYNRHIIDNYKDPY